MTIYNDFSTFVIHIHMMKELGTMRQMGPINDEIQT